MKSRNLRSGIIGIVLGGLMLLRSLSHDNATGSDAYELGQKMAVAFAIAMFVGGVYYLWKAKSEG